MTGTHAKYLGRTGALAVALGIGGAMATTPGVAWADESSSNASSGSTTSESGPSSRSSPDGASTSIGATSTTAKEPDTDEPASEDVDPGAAASSSKIRITDDPEVVVHGSGGAHTSDTDDVAEGHDGTAAEPELELPITLEDVAPRARPRTQRTPPAAPTMGREREQQVASPNAAGTRATSTTGATGLRPRPSEPSSAAHPPTATAGPTAESTSQPLATILTTAAPEPTPTPNAAPTNVLSVTANLINAALAPFLAPHPFAPPDLPLVWAVLAWVRRQFIPQFADQAPAANALQTTQIEPLTPEAAAPVVEAGAAADSPTAADAAVAAAALPPEFERTVLVSDLDAPTDFDFLPDGRILITQQGGTIRVYENGELKDTPLITVPTTYSQERGLLGIEVDPHFEENGYIYLSFTSTTNRARLSRFTVTGDTAAISSELVLLESGVDSGFFHQGGELEFGPDGKLYWGVGDNVFAPNSQSLANIHGKILRINPDGTVPADNPFVSTPGALPQIYAYGLRNPFRFAFTPDGQLLVGDVGSVSWEELNIVTPGANYGWPFAEGPCQGCAFANPIYAYARGSGAAISSVLVYTGTALGEEHQNKVFIADYVLGWVKELTFDSNYSSFISEQMVDDQAGTTVKLLQGPDDEAIYQLTIFPGTLSRIALSGGNRAPSAVITATPSNGLAPLAVDFSSADSSDPDPGTTLTYAWNFGDGTTSTAASPSKTYTNNGTYVVTLIVSDGEKTGQAAQNITVGSTAPTAQILTPLNGTLYSAGDTISFTGTGSDAEDDTLPASAYKWRIDFHHAEHIHPFREGIVGPSGSVVIPRDPNNVADTWYRIHLTVTDSSGLSTTQFVDVNPRLVVLTFDTNHPEATYTIDGVPRTGPYTETAVVGVQRVIDAPSPQFVSDGQLEFSHWSDGGAQTHTVITPATNTTYTATYDYVLDHADPWQVLTQIYENQVANVQRLTSAFTTSGEAIAAVPAALVTAINSAIGNPLGAPTIVIQLATDLVEATYSVAAPVWDAITHIVTTEATRAMGVTGALGSNMVPIFYAVVNAPLEVGGAVVDRGNALLRYIAILDPLGAFGQGQLAIVVIQGEFSHQINEIEDAIGTLLDAALTALAVPLPAEAPPLAFQARGPEDASIDGPTIELAVLTAAPPALARSRDTAP